MVRLLVGVGAAAVLLAGCATSLPLDDSKSSGETGGGATVAQVYGDKQAFSDVTLGECGMKDPYGVGQGTPGVEVKITNSSDTPRTYLVTVAFESTDGATQYGTGIASADGLAPGQSKNDTVMLLGTSSEEPSDFVCKVIEVSSY